MLDQGESLAERKKRGSKKSGREAVAEDGPGIKLQATQEQS